MKRFLFGFAVASVLGGFVSCTQTKTQNNTEVSNADSVMVCDSTIQAKLNAKYPANSPVAKYGALKVVGNQLCDWKGNPVQLAGMSTMGWQWCGDCYTKESVSALVKDWNISVLRLAMYVEEGGYNSDPEGFTKRMCDLVDYCGAEGIYCLVDWHILVPGDPNHALYKDAEKFFKFMASKYAGAEHVIFEICNEPNNHIEVKPDQRWVCTKEENVTWEKIAEYANKIVPAIHAAYDSVGASHPIVIVGTPQWDQLVDACLKEGMYQGNGKDLSDSLPEKDSRLKYDNIMYAFHFYANSHNGGFPQGGKQDYYNFYSYMYDVLGKLPVFCSECGVCNADGRGDANIDATDKWFLMFCGNNAGKQLVSFCNWSFCDDPQTSAALKPGACKAGNWNDVTVSGEYIKKVFSVLNGGAQDSSVLKKSNLYQK